jgi:hypothetical protein
MKKPKPLDALEMKNHVQAELCREREGLSDEEVERRRRIWLETSDDPAAKWWRSIQRTEQPS